MTWLVCLFGGHKFGGRPAYDLEGARTVWPFCARCGRLF